MQTIETKVIDLGKPIGVDPFSVYRRTTQRYGDRHAFLAESISGPMEDCKKSVVTIGHLASISFFEDGMCVEANCQIKDHLVKTVESFDSGVKFNTSGVAKFTSKVQIFTALKSIVLSSYTQDKCNNSFHAGFIVRIDYDAASIIEEITWRLPRNSKALIRLDLYQHTAVFQEGNVRLYINRTVGFDEPNEAELKNLFTPIEEEPSFSSKSVEVDFSITKEEYLSACDIALEHIHAGNIYQVQLGHSIHIKNDMSPSRLYALLRRQNPSPYMFLHQAPDMDLIGASPESYVRLEGRRLSMRPIAGTLGKSPDLDAHKLNSELFTSQKENAEHIMLVDLCRNDIGRLCEAGTLTVSSLMKMEEFPSLYHLVSTVEGTLKPEVNPVDVILSTFPAGTMVGAPKIRAMEIIESLEKTPRNQYAGAIGFVGFNGSMNMALCIRMACHRDGEYQIRASAGIVYDSNPEREWQETLTKMRLLYRTLTDREIA